MSNNERKINKSAVVAVAILLVLVIGATIAYFTLRPAPRDRSPQVTIVVEVTHGDQSTREFTIATDALNLRGALEQENLIEGEDRGYFFVLTVDGESVDESLQQWWCFTRGGEMLMTGVDDTPIADGEHYEIVLTTGW